MTYEDIFSKFLSKGATGLEQYSEEIAYEYMRDYLSTAITNAHIQTLFKNIELDEELEVIRYTLKEKGDLDERFLIDIIAEAMMIARLDSKIDDNINLAAVIGGKEEKVLLNNYKSNIERVQYLNQRLQKKICKRGYQVGTKT